MAAKSTHAAPTIPRVLTDVTFTLVSVSLEGRRTAFTCIAHVTLVSTDSTGSRPMVPAKVWGIGSCLKADAIGIRLAPAQGGKGHASVPDGFVAVAARVRHRGVGPQTECDGKR